MHRYNSLDSEPIGRLEMAEAASRRPRMLVVDVRPLIAQPVLEYVEIAGFLPTLRLAAGPTFRHG